MGFVVTAEATWKIRVAQIVLVCAPRDPKIGEDVLVINGENRIGRRVDVCGPGLKCCGLLLTVVPAGNRVDESLPTLTQLWARAKVKDY